MCETHLRWVLQLESTNNNTRADGSQLVLARKINWIILMILRKFFERSRQVIFWKLKISMNLYTRNGTFTRFTMTWFYQRGTGLRSYKSLHTPSPLKREFEVTFFQWKFVKNFVKFFSRKICVVIFKNETIPMSRGYMLNKYRNMRMCEGWKVPNNCLFSWSCLAQYKCRCYIIFGTVWLLVLRRY